MLQLDAIATPEDFFRVVVEPNFHDYEEHRDLRCAMNFAVSCVALRDWFAKSRGLNPGALQAEMTKSNAELGYCTDAANALKHLEGDKGARRRGDRDVGFDGMRCGDPCNTALQEPAFITAAGERILFRDIAWTTVAVWRAKLQIA